MFEIEAVGELSIRENPSPEVSPDTLQRVEELWRQALADGTLSNDQIFSLGHRQGAVLSGWFAEYRCWVAQMRDPELFPALSIRLLAVTGVLRVPGGIVLGRRSKAMLQDPGLWERAPSGGITPRARNSEGEINPEVQLLIELEEELGVPADVVRSVAPLALIEEHQSHVCDLIYELRVEIPFEDLHKAFRTRGSGEYDEVRLVKSGELEVFRSTEARTLSPMSRQVLERIAP